MQIGLQYLSLNIVSQYADSGIQPLRVVTAPNYLARGQTASSGSNTRFIARRPFYIGQGGASQLVPSFANNFATQTSVGTGNTVTILSAAIEKGDGSASTPVTFDSGVNRTKALAWDTADIQADPVLPSAFSLSQFAAGELYWERIVYEVATTGQSYPNTATVRSGYTGYGAYAYNPATFPSLTADGTGALDGTSKTAVTTTFCAVILGRPLVGGTRHFVGVGDSYTRDNDSETFQGSLFPLRLLADVFERAMIDQSANPASIYGFLNTGVYGTGIANYSAANDRRAAYYKYCTDLHCEYGVNDVGTRTLAQMQTDLGALWAKVKLEGVARIWRTKLFGSTTSTDSYVTEANQTVAAPYTGAGAVGFDLNLWFDTKVSDGTLAGVIPWGRLRGQTSFYKWRVNDNVAAWSIAGNHPSAYAGVPIMSDEARSIVRPNPSNVPGAVSGLTVGSSDTTITATWTAASNSPSDHLVEISPAGANTWTALHTYDVAPTYCWTGLPSGTNYDIRVTPINCKGSGTSTTATRATTGAPTGLILDSVATAAAHASSSRRLRSVYTGPAYWVMRSVDNMEAGVYFDGSGNLDTAWLVAWARGGDVVVKRRYDQSPGATNFNTLNTSYNNTLRPAIVLSGALQGIGSKASEFLTKNPSSNRKNYPSGTLTTAPTQRAICAVVNHTGTFGAFDGGILGGVNNGYSAVLNSAGKPNLSKLNGTSIGTATNANTVGAAGQLSVTFDTVSGAYAFFKDGAANGSGTNVQTFTSGNATLGCTDTGGTGINFTGYIGELIVFDAAIPSTGDRQAVEASQKAYWGTP